MRRESRLTVPVTRCGVCGCRFCACRVLDYIKTPDNFGGTHVVLSTVAVALFALSTGCTRSTAFWVGARRVRLADRPTVSTLCSASVLAGVFPACLFTYLANQGRWLAA